MPNANCKGRRERGEWRSVAAAPHVTQFCSRQVEDEVQEQKKKKER